MGRNRAFACYNGPTSNADGIHHVSITLDVPEWGYDELLGDTIALESDGVVVRVLGLARLIDVKVRAGRPKDRAVLPVLIATLDEQTDRKTS